MPMWITVITYVVIALPLGYALMFTAGMGTVGMWISFVVALTIAAVAFHWRFRRLFSKQDNSGKSIVESQ